MTSSTCVICKQPGRYIGWPTICRTRNGELLVAFSGDRDGHVCPWGKVQLVRSSDNGVTWSAPETVCDSPLDDRDAGIIETRSGALVVAWFTSLVFEECVAPEVRKDFEALHGDKLIDLWHQRTLQLTFEDRQQWIGHWTVRSEDGGRTWQAPVRTRGSAPHGPIELRDGRLLYVGCINDNVGAGRLTVEASDDDGRSWKQIAAVPVGPDDNPASYYEPHVVECADGRLVAHIRYHAPLLNQSDANVQHHFDLTRSYLRQSVSVDGGHTWTPAAPTPLLGFPPHLIRLRDERLLCSYARRFAPYGEYTCVSSDNGETWDVQHESFVAEAADGDLGYPASVELEDGSILTVYYQIDQPGEKTCLMATRWNLQRGRRDIDK